MEKKNWVKICYIGSAKSSIHIKKWAEEFKTKGYNLIWITTEIDKSLKLKQYKLRYGIPFFASKDSMFRYCFSPISILQTKKILKKEKPNIVHIYYAGHAGILSYFVNFKPSILSVLGSDIYVTPNNKFFRFFILKALEKVAIITTESKDMKETLIKKFKINETKIRQFIWGVSFKIFNKNNTSKELEKHFKEKSVVISTRNFAPVYNHETLIMAAKEVLKHNHSAGFIIKGYGSDENNLRNLVKKLGLENNLKIIGGKIPHNKIANYLNLGKIYVSCSLSDTIPISVLEAMACGLAPVVSDIPGNREIIKDGVNGFIFPKKDYKKLAEILTRLLNNPKLTKKISQNAMKFVKKNADWKNSVKNMEKVYKSVLSYNEK